MRANNTSKLMGTLGRANLTRMNLILFSGSAVPSAIIQNTKYRNAGNPINYLHNIPLLRSDLAAAGYKTLAYIDVAAKFDLFSVDTIISRLKQEPIVMLEAGTVGWFMLLGRVAGTVTTVGDCPLAMCGTVTNMAGGGDAVMGNTSLAMSTDVRILDIKLRI